MIDILKTPLENLLDLVNAANSLTISDAQVTAAAPEVIGSETDPINTSVVLTAVPLGGYTGTVEVSYRRLRLDANVVAPQETFFTDDTTLLSDLKTTIATALNLLEDQFSFSGTLPGYFGEITVGTLTASAGSLLYVGTLNINMEWSTALDDAVGITSLGGFTPA